MNKVIYSSTQHEVMRGDTITIDSDQKYRVVQSNGGRLGHVISVCPVKGKSPQDTRNYYYNCFDGLEMGEPKEE